MSRLKNYPGEVGMTIKNYVELTDENLDRELASTEKLVLVDCWNESCIVCRRVWPMLEQLASRYEDRVKLTTLNVDKNPQTLDRFIIKGLPTLLFIKKGQLLETVSGVRTRSELIEVIEQHSSPSSESK